MAEKQTLEENTKSELKIVLQRFDETSLSKNNNTRVVKGTESVTPSSKLSTRQRILKSFSKCLKITQREPNPVEIPEKPVPIKKKILITVLKSHKTVVRFFTPKSPSSSKSANNNLKEDRVNGTVKKHKCMKCGKSFSRRSHLVDHTYTHSGEKPHCCYYCNRSFTSKSNLVKHVRIHTGVKPFVCNVCKKPFTLKKNMIDHKRTHSGEKLYGCTLCEQRFTRYNTGVRHLKIHTREKYECYECLEKFEFKLRLQRHITAKHLNDKSWRPKGCNDAPKTEDGAVLQLFQPEIVFVDCKNLSGDNFAMHSNTTRGSPIDETNFEIKEENDELAGSSGSPLHEKKKGLVIVVTPVITRVFSLAAVSATPAQMPSKENAIIQNTYENTCQKLCVKLERIKIHPIKMEEN